MAEAVYFSQQVASILTRLRSDASFGQSVGSLAQTVRMHHAMRVMSTETRCQKVAASLQNVSIKARSPLEFIPIAVKGISRATLPTPIRNNGGPFYSWDPCKLKVYLDDTALVG